MGRLIAWLGRPLRGRPAGRTSRKSPGVNIGSVNVPVGGLFPRYLWSGVVLGHDSVPTSGPSAPLRRAAGIAHSAGRLAGNLLVEQFRVAGAGGYTAGVRRVGGRHGGAVSAPSSTPGDDDVWTNTRTAAGTRSADRLVGRERSRARGRGRRTPCPVGMEVSTAGARSEFGR